MARVLVARQPWGTLWEKAADRKLSVPLSGTVASINTTVYSASTGSGTVSSFVTDTNGELPGWVDEGTHTLTVNSVASQVEAISGAVATNGGPAKIDRLPVNVADYGPVATLTDATSKAANVTAFNNAIARANTDKRALLVPPATYYFTANTTLTTLTGCPGMIGTWGKTILEFNNDGNCIVSKGTLQKWDGVYIINRAAAHAAVDGALRIKNCAYGDFRNLYAAVGGTGAPRAIMLEHEYDGSTGDADFIAHLGCWYNRFDNVTAGYLVTGANVGYGISLEVNANAVGVVNPPGQTAGTYTGSASHNTITGMNAEGMARGINLDRAVGNAFVGGQILGCATQVYARNSSSSNLFDTMKFNQAGTQIADVDTNSLDNEFRNPLIFPTTVALGTFGSRAKFDSPVYSIGGGAPAVGWATGWQNVAGFEGALYYKEGQTVRLQGMAQKTTAPADGNIILTLPVGFRPAGLIDITAGVMKSSVAGTGRCRVNSAGEVIWLAGAGAANDYMELTLSFRAT